MHGRGSSRPNIGGSCTSMTPSPVMQSPQSPLRQLRIFCIEDNPLIVLHLEMLIEELGHIFAGSSDSFADVRSKFKGTHFDVALVDIDLADGRTGGDVAAWLRARGRPSIFVTGQEQLAATYTVVSVAVIVKPVTSDLLSASLQGIER
jgi:DNA-binding LytR/AlgR family response regulator